MLSIRSLMAIDAIPVRMVCTWGRCRCYLAPILLFSLIFGTTCPANSPVLIQPFSSMDAAGKISSPWQALTFPNIERHTQYRAVRMEGRTVVRAESNNSASGLIHNLNFNPDVYPWLHWQWRVEHVMENGDVTTKQGDDCAARLYVAFKFIPEGKSIWERFRHRAACIAAGRELPGSALTYIWASKTPRGTVIDSPYAEQSKVLVIQSGAALASQWIDEKRNIVNDYKTAFGHAPPPVIGIAIMTDTDNTGESATTYYGGIRIEKIE